MKGVKKLLQSINADRTFYYKRRKKRNSAKILSKVISSIHKIKLTSISLCTDMNNTLEYKIACIDFFLKALIA